MVKGYVILEDGTVYKGKSFGAEGEALGEVVFNTSLTGYQEIITDPSYNRQAVVMTYPQIGNYGVNREDVESDRVHVEGLIVREACAYPSNFTAVMSLGEYLRQEGVVGIEKVDTRSLTRHIREAGSMKAVLYAGTKEPDVAALAKKAHEWEGLSGVDSVREVTCSEPYVFTGTPERPVPQDGKYNVVAIDYGVKSNILRMLSRAGCRVTVVPAQTTATEILAMNPHGVFLSNGPGDPSAVTYAHTTIRELIGTVPLFGICLGHQLLTIAYGGAAYKLKFGHHGGNHPIQNRTTGSVEITAQNHCYCTDMNSLSHTTVEETHVNLNDETCAGIRDRKNRVLAVQYHPEASPGPHDSAYLFREFIDMINDYISEKNKGFTECQSVRIYTK
ncbi:glutamine-hydrolyzing carbamoyl-phosphate synthase small subunit [Chitinivibrio alkaliphilus]|uniref:Carbamoyl phosphate synthase small chain n=1 Tax=Chitinivibrio alkaliphilus ACht1 TaxID=1313304 RepID=U7D609_9BACT|nr:glutamine-hydrolyzing carbamoyl-phosphate synthase small subunit [Chitinivibrio alkaliphilus]ERP31368.1 Carbamoyl-phosphate synthase, small subunit [Chitinivibrio alkaliphilus ACht1]